MVKACVLPLDVGTLPNHINVNFCVCVSRFFAFLCLHRTFFNLHNKINGKEKLCILTASIKIWRSGSGRCWPIFCRPSFNSSRVILPLLFMSIFPNNSLIPATSSTDKCSATTCEMWNSKAVSTIKDLQKTDESRGPKPIITREGIVQ